MSRTYRDIQQAKLKKQSYRRTGELWRESEFVVIEFQAERREYDPKSQKYIPTGEYYTGKVYLKRAGYKPKQKRNKLEFGQYWYAECPKWFRHEFMTVPKRARCRNWERKAVTLPVDLLDFLPDCPDYGNKPHMYYY